MHQISKSARPYNRNNYYNQSFACEPVVCLGRDRAFIPVGDSRHHLPSTGHRVAAAQDNIGAVNIAAARTLKETRPVLGGCGDWQRLGAGTRQSTNAF
jgi:hypothetical protein